MPLCCLVHVEQSVLSLAVVDCTSYCKALQVETSIGYAFAALQLPQVVSIIGLTTCMGCCLTASKLLLCSHTV